MKYSALQEQIQTNMFQALPTDRDDATVGYNFDTPDLSSVGVSVGEIGKVVPTSIPILSLESGVTQHMLSVNAFCLWPSNRSFLATGQGQARFWKYGQWFDIVGGCT